MLILIADGELYVFGGDRRGSLGLGEGKIEKLGFFSKAKLAARFIKATPVKHPFFADRKIKVKKVVCGRFHTIALTEEGQVYTWGQGRRHFFPFFLNWMNDSEYTSE